MAKRCREPGLSGNIEDEGMTTIVKKQRGSASFSTTSRRASTQSKAALKPKVIDSPAKAPTNKIIVSIDFGTTYSGIAFVVTVSSDARDVRVVTEWPGVSRANELLEKVPSRIAYPSENENISEIKWGYDVEPGMKSYSWFKLLLDANAAKTDFDTTALTGTLQEGLMDLPVGKDAQDVVTDYLSELHKYTMNRLERAYSADIINVTHIDFWFTVPATWDEAAAGSTRDAAIGAGFGSRQGDEVYMITEPEAAAIAAMTRSIEQNPGLYKVGMNVLLADLGGGTQDYQCLTIESLNPVRTTHAIMGDGGKSGSTSIDCAFHKWLKANFRDAFECLPVIRVGAGSKFMNEFETIKKMFNGLNLNKKYQLNLPMLGKALKARKMHPTQYDFDEYNVEITGHDIAEMFQQVIDKAFAIMDSQCVALKEEKLQPFRAICLCGGLGNSEYVWLKFQEYINQRMQGKCRLVNDERAWSAVVRGAAIRGLDGSFVLAKKSKCFYGLGVHQVFREGVDNEANAFICPFEGKRASGYVDWVLKKSRKFTPNLRLESKVYVAIDPSWEEHEKKFAWDLFCCKLDEAPERSDDKVVVMKQGVIRMDLSKAFSKSKDCGDGKLQKAEVRIVFKLGNERGVIIVEAMLGRTVVGTGRIDYTRSHVRQTVQTPGLL